MYNTTSFLSRKLRQSLASIPLCLGLLGPVIACGCGSHAHDDDHLSAEQEGCEHMQKGPAVSATATAERDQAPGVQAHTHKRVDIALTDVDGGKGGFVAFQASKATDHMFFVDDTVPFEVTTADGTTVAIESTRANAHCPSTIPAQHTVELDVGTYYLRFGPSQKEQVSLVFEAIENEHD